VAQCTKCGKESPDEARFCRACGAPLTKEAPAATPAAGVTPEERARRLLEDAFRLSEEGRVLAAIEACKQAVSLNPRSTSAHSLLGTLYERQGERDDAIREYEQVLTLSPGSTAERRRLNELMGVPSAREAIRVSPRTARLAVTGGSLVVVLVLVAAIAFTVQQGPRPRPQRRARAPIAQPQQEAVASATTAIAPSPGRRLASTWRPSLRVAAPRRTSQPTPVQIQRGAGFGQWLGQGAYLLPSGGSERFYGLRSTGGVRARSYQAAPFANAARVRAASSPVVRMPTWRSSNLATVAAGRSPRPARDYYLQGNSHRSIQAYETYIARNPQAGAAPHEELAWVYADSGYTGSAVQEYRTALSQYRTDLDRQHNVEAAKHGVRTCESAVDALETR